MKIVYGVWDKKAASYPWPPMFCNHPADATRQIKMALENPQSSLAKWPSEYSLMTLGHFDESNGMFMPTATGFPEHCIEVAALLTVEQQERSNNGKA